MRLPVLSTITTIGASGIIAQVMVFRELLVSFCGNELTLGIVLASWVLAESLGAFLFGRFSDKAGEKAGWFIVLQTLFCAGFFCSVWLARVWKSFGPFSWGEGVGLGVIAAVSLLAMLPAGFAHGALFSSACSWLAGVHGVYVWETLGTIAGGVILTYFLLPFFDTFQIVLIVTLVNLSVCALLSGSLRQTAWRRFFVLCSLFLFLIAAYTASGIPQASSLKRQWKGMDLVDYGNSPYGNIALLRRGVQHTFFYNGMPIVSAPRPDEFMAQEHAHLPLLLHPFPLDILVIGGGSGGLIYEAAKHPLRAIDYAEQDPLLIKMFRRHPLGLIYKELSDHRLTVIHTDARRFLRRNNKPYDTIIMNIGEPAVLSSNRYFTEEFFLTVKKKLKPAGIFAFSLPGSGSYLSDELRDLNAGVFNALKHAFKYVRVLPGEHNMFFASEDQQVIMVDARLAEKRMQLRKVNAAVFTPAYLSYRFNPAHLGRYNKAMEEATGSINSDTRPYAVFASALWWNRRFSPQWARVVSFCAGMRMRTFVLLIAFLTVILLLVFRAGGQPASCSVGYSVLSAGFLGMLLNLALVFMYQTASGYLYRDIGLLISIFMAGLAAGGLIGGRSFPDNRARIRMLVVFEFLAFALSLITGMLAAKAGQVFQGGILVFIPLLFVAGMCAGAPFVLAAGIHRNRDTKPGRVAGLLNALDLSGALIAGLSTGIILLPLLGIWNTCVLAALVKAGSLLFLLLFGREERA